MCLGGPTRSFSCSASHSSPSSILLCSGYLSHFRRCFYASSILLIFSQLGLHSRTAISSRGPVGCNDFSFQSASFASGRIHFAAGRYRFCPFLHCFLGTFLVIPGPLSVSTTFGCGWGQRAVLFFFPTFFRLLSFVPVLGCFLIPVPKR